MTIQTECLATPLPDLVEGPRCLVEFHARIAAAFNGAPGRPDRDDPDGLRTCISTPGAARDGGYKKQAETRHDKQSCDVVEFLRPDFDKKK